MPAYAYLKTDIINTAENESTEFSDQISYFVNRAEDRLVKELDDSGLDYYTSVTLSTGNPNVTLPSGALVVRNVTYKTSASSNIIPLLQRPYEYAIDYWPYASTSTGTPRYYSRKNNTEIYIVPTPASTVVGEVHYTKSPLALSSATGTSATTSNYFSEFCYNALFNACMIEATMFMKSWNNTPLWEAQYKNSIDALRNQARRTRRDDMETPANPGGGPDTVIQGAN